MTQTTPPKKSDLGVRTLSAIVMVAVAGTALWLGGWVWTGFVTLVALGVLWEWWGLVRGFEQRPTLRAFWQFFGFFYIAVAAFGLFVLSEGGHDMRGTLMVIAAVVATDIGAYFAGRSIGGPKIAPKISPSKTWAGLAGGVLGASLVLALWDTCLNEVPVGVFEDWRTCMQANGSTIARNTSQFLVPVLLAGFAVAVVAQIGDFFESWLKRRAGVKDSGNLIPGHGGLFDRADGLLAVSFCLGLLYLPGWLSN